MKRLILLCVLATLMVSCDENYEPKTPSKEIFETTTEAIVLEKHLAVGGSNHVIYEFGYLVLEYTKPEHLRGKRTMLKLEGDELEPWVNMSVNDTISHKDFE